MRIFLSDEYWIIKGLINIEAIKKTSISPVDSNPKDHALPCGNQFNQNDLTYYKIHLKNNEIVIICEDRQQANQG